MQWVGREYQHIARMINRCLEVDINNISLWKLVVVKATLCIFLYLLPSWFSIKKEENNTKKMDKKKPSPFSI